jgi:hypothetical protein
MTQNSFFHPNSKWRKRKEKLKKGETTLKQEKVHAFEAHAWSLCAKMEFNLQVGANPIKSWTKPW